MRFVYEIVYDRDRRVLVVEKKSLVLGDVEAVKVRVEIPMEFFPEVGKVLDYIAEAYPNPLTFYRLKRFFWRLERAAELQGRERVSLTGDTWRFVTVKALERLGVDGRRLKREIRRLRREVWRRVVLVRPPSGAVVCKAEWKSYSDPFPRWLRRRAYAARSTAWGDIAVFSESVMVWDSSNKDVKWFGFYEFCDVLGTLTVLVEEFRRMVKDDRDFIGILRDVADILREKAGDEWAETLVGLLATVGV